MLRVGVGEGGGGWEECFTSSYVPMKIDGFKRFRCDIFDERLTKYHDILNDRIANSKVKIIKKKI